MRQTLLILLSVLSLGLANPLHHLDHDDIDSPFNATLVARSELNGPCTGEGGAPGVCVKTTDCTADGGKYITGACPGTPNNIKCCTKTSCKSGSGGNCRWTKQCSSGKTATGFCPGPANFKCCLPGSGGGDKPGGGDSGGSTGSAINKPITRKEIIDRGMDWIKKHVPYSMERSYPDRNGRKYRTDCSGFVSMALHTNSPGYTTVTLGEIAKEINWDELQPGDFVGTLGRGTAGAGGHVTLFHSWVGGGKKRYKALECRGKAYGCVAYERPIKWKTGEGKVSKPYRYTRVK